MFASTVLNYMDRQTISLVKEQITTAFAIKADVDFGWVLAAFSMTYALFPGAGGLSGRSLGPAMVLCGGGGLVVAGGDGDRGGSEPGDVDRLPGHAGSG